MAVQFSNLAGAECPINSKVYHSFSVGGISKSRRFAVEARSCSRLAHSNAQKTLKLNSPAPVTNH